MLKGLSSPDFPSENIFLVAPSQMVLYLENRSVDHSMDHIGWDVFEDVPGGALDFLYEPISAVQKDLDPRKPGWSGILGCPVDSKQCNTYWLQVLT